MLASRLCRAVSFASTPSFWASFSSSFSSVSSASPHYLGVHTVFTNSLQFTPENSQIPTYHVLDMDGGLVDEAHQVQVDDDTLVRLYESMVRLSIVDKIFYDMQRQGRISFYMASSGEEALQFGSAAALRPDDVVYGQYREPGVICWRGFTLDDLAAQCFSNTDDLGKGRQMPIHYGSAALHFHTISSPLSTQIPQATGAAYALKREGKGRVAVCYFGDGAASEGDFHPALNFASTLDCPVLFFCRNNGYAISTPTTEQYGGDGVAVRGVGYGIQAVRVDGNDVLAVYEATAEARNKAVSTNRPVLLEAMTYRGAHHSTSDDSTQYREKAEMQAWNESNNPLRRTRRFLQARQLWDDDKEEAHRAETRREVLQAVAKAEARPLPPIEDLFTDVYDQQTPLLRRQQRQLQQHLEKYPQSYKLEQYDQSKTE